MSYPYPDPRSEKEPEDAMNAASGTDCTGLIPANPENAEGYDELRDYLPKAVSDGKNDGV